MNVLVVDDAVEVLDLLTRALEKDGHDVRTAGSLARARFEIAREAPAVLILDVGLPDGTGVDLCRGLRREGAVFPILLLTARGEVAQRVAGLDAGADDFLAKPFAVAELRARIRALGRRGPIERGVFIDLGGAQLDLAARRAHRGEEPLPITAREWAILDLLVARRGRVVERTALLEQVWGEVNDRASASLDVIMARIRRKLGTHAVRTVRGEGYTVDG